MAGTVQNANHLTTSFHSGSQLHRHRVNEDFAAQFPSKMREIEEGLKDFRYLEPPRKYVELKRRKLKLYAYWEVSH